MYFFSSFFLKSQRNDWLHIYLDAMDAFVCSRKRKWNYHFSQFDPLRLEFLCLMRFVSCCRRYICVDEQLQQNHFRIKNVLAFFLFNYRFYLCHSSSWSAFFLVIFRQRLFFCFFFLLSWNTFFCDWKGKRGIKWR